MKKKVFSKSMSWILSVVMILGMFVLCGTKSLTVNAEMTMEQFNARLSELQQKYPTGYVWKGKYYGKYELSNEYINWVQCKGFAHLMGYEVFNSDPGTWSVDYNFSHLEPGDIIQFGDPNINGGNHSVFCTSVSGDTYYFVDCNGNGNRDENGKYKAGLCMVLWGDKGYISKGSLYNGLHTFSYLIKSPIHTVNPTPDPIIYDYMNVGEKYYLKNNGTGTYMSIDYGEDIQCKNISVYQMMGSTGQQFEICASDYDKTYFLRPVLCESSGRVVNINGEYAYNNANIMIYNFTGHSTQQWKFRPVSGGYAICSANNTNYCISESGTNVQMTTYTGASNQIWTLESVNKPVEFKNISKISSTSIIKGNGINVICASTGGEGTKKYAVYYKKVSASSWTTAQSYSTTTSVTVTPKYADIYTIRVKVKDGSGAVKSKDFTVTVTAPLTNTSKVSATSIIKGSSVKITCASTGGTGTKKYAVYYKKASASSWTTAQSYSTTTSVTVTPKYAEVYTIRVKAKDGSGVVKSKNFKVTVTAPLTNTSKVSATSIIKGSSVKITCASTGGTGTKKYAVYYKKASASSWTTAQNYSTTTSVTVTPKYAEVYTIRVKAKDGSDTVKSKDLKVTVTAPLTNTSKLASSTVILGSAAKVTCASTGGTGTKKYAVYYKKASDFDWTTVQDYDINTSVMITIMYAEDYTIRVNVKDDSGIIIAKDFTINAALENTSTIISNDVELGSYVVVNASAVGGTGNYTYAVYYKKASASSWTKAQGYNSNTSVSFLPQYRGEYYVSVIVKDSLGNVSKQTFTITVK